MKSRSIEPLPTWAIETMQEFVCRYGDVAASEHFGFTQHTCCRAALGLPMHPRTRYAIIDRLEKDQKAVAA